MKSTDRQQDEYRQRAGDRFPLKRFGKPDIVLGILLQHDGFGMGGLIQLGWIDLKTADFPAFALVVSVFFRHLMVPFRLT